MPSNVEFLASPPIRRRPVLRAVVTVVAAGLLAWALVARLSTNDPGTPTAAPPLPETSPSPRALPYGPPPWVRYPSRLEGRWVADGRSGHILLFIHNAYLDLWQGVGQQQDAPTTRRFITVIGNRVSVRTSGGSGEVATYRWERTGGRLTFDLVEQTPKSLSLLDGLSFRAVRD